MIDIFGVFCSEWGKTIPKPFGLRYNAYTQRVEILDSKSSIKKLASDIKYEMSILDEALNKL